mmetsp:Transcript_14776/g.25167  ORF Transcript_14776/g.25167 Transcript_14776/m.25167 type:complete len:222 (+) Transcript_14776:2674-3339(+)
MHPLLLHRVARIPRQRVGVQGGEARVPGRRPPGEAPAAAVRARSGLWRQLVACTARAPWRLRAVLLLVVDGNAEQLGGAAGAGRAGHPHAVRQRVLRLRCPQLLVGQHGVRDAQHHHALLSQGRGRPILLLLHPRQGVGRHGGRLQDDSDGNAARAPPRRQREQHLLSRQLHAFHQGWHHQGRHGVERQLHAQLAAHHAPRRPLEQVHARPLPEDCGGPEP